jgi:pimeloyl-ACP methyl ester carboxylesterase
VTSTGPHPGRGREIVLLPGLWLPGTVWGDVVARLHDLGHHPVVPPLPGVDDGDASATLEDQIDAVVSAVDAALETAGEGGGRPVVVGHSAACGLAWLAADRRPDAIGRVVMIGGWPSTHGSLYADLFPVADGVMPFPGWEPFEGPDAADLDDAARDAMVASAVPVPEGVARGTVLLTDERRRAIPVTLVCPEFSPEDARGWVEAGHLPELARIEQLTYVDIDSGHWPMVSRPDRLARVLDQVVSPT